LLRSTKYMAIPPSINTFSIPYHSMNFTKHIFRSLPSIYEHSFHDTLDREVIDRKNFIIEGNMYMPTFLVDELLDMDATTIARNILEKRISIYDVVSTFISHAKKENAYIHAIVEDRFEDALIEAKDKDRRLKTTTQVGPLFGVPISVKESFNVQGMKTTGGLVHLKNNRATHDAEVIQSLKEAGAIIICKTNTPALCFCQETDNKLYGRTNNAWKSSNTAGGSSGGEAALLSVGGAAVGIGSDIGGSIRFPSHFNGIIGFKPGKHQVSSVGHFPEETIPLQKRMAG